MRNEMGQIDSDAAIDAYSELSAAIVRLSAVRLGLFGIGRGAIREANAVAIRAARELVASARARLAALTLADLSQSALLDRIRAELSPLPKGMIVEPFGWFEAQGARSLEASGAARDRQEIEHVLGQLRALILAIPVAQTKSAQLDAWDRERAASVGIEWLLLTRKNPLVWLGLFFVAFRLIRCVAG